MNVEQESQAILQKAIGLRQQSEEIEGQLNFVSEQIKELKEFSENLEILEKSEEDEMLANIGRGVYMKVNKKKEDLFVEVGAGVVVKKTPKEAREIIEGQVKKFKEAKTQLTEQLQGHADEFRKMLSEIEKMKN